MSDIYDVIANAMAKTLWLDAWASWTEEQHRVNRHDPRHYPMGCKRMEDYAPEVPPRAYSEAWRLFGAIEALNDTNMAALCNKAWLADGSPGEKCENFCWVHAGEKYWQEFGHYLVMEALGHGVAWSDSHADIEVKFPLGTYVDFDDELEALKK